MVVGLLLACWPTGKQIVQFDYKIQSYNNNNWTKTKQNNSKVTNNKNIGTKKKNKLRTREKCESDDLNRRPGIMTTAIYE